MSVDSIQNRTAKISVLFEERLRLKGPDLSRQAYKAGRRLPRGVRRELKIILEASERAAHPKLARMIDQARFEKAVRYVTAYLEQINPRDEKIGRILGVLGKVSAVLIVAFVVVVWGLWSRGIV